MSAARVVASEFTAPQRRHRQWIAADVAVTLRQPLRRTAREIDDWLARDPRDRVVRPITMASSDQAPIVLISIKSGDPRRYPGTAGWS